MRDLSEPAAGRQPNWTVARVKKFCSRAREHIGDKPFIVSSFGFLPYHEPQLMAAADPYVDAFAPQVYWFWYPKEAMFGQPGALARPLARRVRSRVPRRLPG